MRHAVNVKLNTNINVVASKDLEILVRGNDRKLGTLLISQGNIEWRPAFKQIKKHRLSWNRFAALMAAEGRTIKRRRGKKASKKASNS